MKKYWEQIDLTLDGSKAEFIGKKKKSKMKTGKKKKRENLNTF